MFLAGETHSEPRPARPRFHPHSPEASGARFHRSWQEQDRAGALVVVVVVADVGMCCRETPTCDSSLERKERDSAQIVVPLFTSIQHSCLLKQTNKQTTLHFNLKQQQQQGVVISSSSILSFCHFW